MELESPKMEARPPKLIEAAVRVLLPPACREHVLGDLSERYRSPWQYAAEALRTLPLVIASQIRRVVDLLLLIAQVVPVFLFFGGLWVSRTETPGLPAWIRALVPAAAAAVALVLRDAYKGDGDPPSGRRALLDSAFAIACALLSQTVIAQLIPGALVARTVPYVSVVSFVVLFLQRRAMAHWNAPKSTPMTPDEFVRNVHRFERSSRQTMRQEVIAGLVVIVTFGFFLWRGPDLIVRIGCVLSMAGAALVIYRVRTKAVPRAVPLNVDLATSVAVFREELLRQRDLLRAVVRWYLLPMFPGMAVFVLGTLPRPEVALRFLGLFVFVGFLTLALNRRAANRIDQKIARLAALDNQ